MSNDLEPNAIDPAPEFVNQDWSLRNSQYDPDGESVALFWAARNGDFAGNFADYEMAAGTAERLGATRPWLLQLGADIGKALAGGASSYPKAIAGLQCIIRRLVRETGAGKPHHLAASYYLQWVASIQNELETRRDGQSTRGRYAHIFGVFIAALEYMRARGMKPSAAALFDSTERLACANETETRTAVAIFCRNVPLEAWLKPVQPAA